MKYDWNSEKNEQLKMGRGISFEQIILHLVQGDVWKEAEHPDQKRYPKQRIYFVIVEGYIYLVPYKFEKDNIFLKTTIPRLTLRWRDNMKFDREEKAILDAYESGKIKTRTPSKSELKNIKDMAESTFKKDKRITLRLYEHDYYGIQKKALELGVPYQTIISGIIHSYIEGGLIQKNG